MAASEPFQLCRSTPLLLQPQAISIMTRERTYIMVKPDGVQRHLVGEIIKRFETKGYKLVALKLARPSREHLEQHYADLAGRPFFAGLINYMVRS